MSPKVSVRAFVTTHQQRHGASLCRVAGEEGALTERIGAPYDPAAAATASPPYFAPQRVFAGDGFSLLFSATIFGQMGHTAVFSIAAVLRDKSQAKAVWGLGFLTNAALQIVLSASCVLFFGAHTSPISTLNWKDYTGGAAGTGPPPAWASLASWMVVMMPVITISAGYPIQSTVLANNLLHAIPKSTWRALTRAFACGQSSSEADALVCHASPEGPGSPGRAEAWPPLRVKVAARLASCLPPLLPALLVKDASKITRVGGLVGFLLSLMIPCLLQWRSTHFLRRLWPGPPDAARTPYSSVFSGYACVAVVLLVSVIAFAYSVYDTVLKLSA